jgi:hypothetical protein
MGDTSLRNKVQTQDPIIVQNNVYIRKQAPKRLEIMEEGIKSRVSIERDPLGTTMGSQHLCYRQRIISPPLPSLIDLVIDLVYNNHGGVT